MIQDILRVQVNSLVGAVQRFHYLAVNATGHNPKFAPELLPLGRGAPGVDDLASLLSELLQRHGADIEGNLFRGAAFGGDIHILGYRVELGQIADLIALTLTIGHSDDREGQVTSVVGVS